MASLLHQCSHRRVVLVVVVVQMAMNITILSYRQIRDLHIMSQV